MEYTEIDATITKPAVDNAIPTVDNSKEEMPSITCGCGFVVRSWSAGANQATFEEHWCDNAETEEAAPKHWYEYAFSSWAAVIVAIVAVATYKILTH